MLAARCASRSLPAAAGDAVRRRARTRPLPHLRHHLPRHDRRRDAASPDYFAARQHPGADHLPRPEPRRRAHARLHRGDPRHAPGPRLHLGHLGHARRGRAPATRSIPRSHITDIPVVFTLVAAPVLAKIVPDLKGSRPQRDRRLPRRPHRGADARDGLVPARSSRSACSTRPPSRTRWWWWTRCARSARKLGFTVIAKPLKLDAQQEGDHRGRAGDGARAEGSRRSTGSTCRRIPTWARRPRASIIPAAMESGPADLRLDRAADGDRRAHRAGEPLPLDRAVHRLQGGADPGAQASRRRRSRSRRSRASRCR